MTNSIEEQRQVIDQIYRIVRDSCPADFQCAKCRFEYDKFEDGSSSVSQEFYFTKDDKEVSEVLDRKLRSSIMGLVKELNVKMKSHTGGRLERVYVIH